jgi:hypothetical protein
MLLKDFKFENKQTKAKLLARNGVFLVKRRLDDHEVLLFQLGSFYVEMFFNVEEEEIGYIRIFESTDFLQPYLDKIDISALINQPVDSFYS